MANRGQEVEFWNGTEKVKHKIAWEFQDEKLGRKVVVTDGTLDYIRKHKISEDKLLAALKTMTDWGYNERAPGELAFFSENKVFLAFRGNILYNAFVPRNPREYLAEAFEPGTRRKIEKWRKLSGLFSALRMFTG